jgi:hypothetical protein
MERQLIRFSILNEGEPNTITLGCATVTLGELVAAAVSMVKLFRGDSSTG